MGNQMQTTINADRVRVGDHINAGQVEDIKREPFSKWGKRVRIVFVLEGEKKEVAFHAREGVVVGLPRAKQKKGRIDRTALVARLKRRHR